MGKTNVWIQVIFLCLLLAGCGGSSGEVGVGQQQSGPSQAATGQANLTLSFERVSNRAFPLPSRLRIDPRATQVRAQVFDQNLQTLQTREGAIAEVLNFTGLPASQVLVRALFFDDSGNVIGYFDRIFTLGSGSNTLLFDTLLSAPVPNPSFNLTPRLAFTTHPSNSTSGAALNVQVTALDSSGARDTAFNATVQLSLTGATLTSGSAANATGGTVLLSPVAQGSGTGLILLAQAQGFAGAQSLPFSLTQSTTPSPTPSPSPSGEPPATTQPRLSFQSFPDTGVQLSPFNPTIQVQLLDADGNPVQTNGVQVSLSFADDPVPPAGASFFRAPTTQTTVNGVATFTALEINQTGSYRVVASASGFTSVTSGVLTITALPAPRTTTFFVASASGNAAASYANAPSLTGSVTPTTRLNAPVATDVAVDSARDRLYVALTNGLRVFDQVATATGAAAPRASLSFSGGGGMVALDTVNDRLYVAQSSDQLVNIYDNASQLTDASTPSRSITGFTGLPRGLAVDVSRDLLYVSIFNGPIDVFENASSVNDTRTAEVDRSIITTPFNPGYLEVHADRLYVGSESSIKIFNNPHLLTGPQSGITLADTNLGNNPLGIALDAERDELYASQFTSGRKIFVVSNISSFNADATPMPSRTFELDATLGQPIGMDFLVR